VQQSTSGPVLSEVLPLAQDGIFNGVHVLRWYPVYPVPGQFCGTELKGLGQERENILSLCMACHDAHDGSSW